MTTPREELEEIIINMNLPVWNYLINKIMSWHEKCSVDQKKWWCDHIDWDNNGECFIYKFYKNGWLIPENLNWDICPVKGCHAPRPSDD